MNMKNIICYLAFVIFSSNIITACGQKGMLRLPDDSEKLTIRTSHDNKSMYIMENKEPKTRDKSEES